MAPEEQDATARLHAVPRTGGPEISGGLAELSSPGRQSKRFTGRTARRTYGVRRNVLGAEGLQTPPEFGTRDGGNSTGVLLERREVLGCQSGCHEVPVPADMRSRMGPHKVQLRQLRCASLGLISVKIQNSSRISDIVSEPAVPEPACERHIHPGSTQVYGDSGLNIWDRTLRSQSGYRLQILANGNPVRSRASPGSWGAASRPKGEARRIQRGSSRRAHSRLTEFPPTQTPVHTGRPSCGLRNNVSANSAAKCGRTTPWPLRMRSEAVIL